VNGKQRQLATSNGRRLVSTIQRVEQDVYDYLPERRPPRLPGASLSVALTTTTITARSGTTPGGGSVKLQKYDGSVLSDATGTTVFVHNYSSAAAGIASGKYCLVAQSWGAWWVVSTEC
jgi:hypothetical protein